MRSIGTALVGILLTATLGPAVQGADLPIDRSIAKQPGYTAKQPLYGLLVFGPAKESRVWMVLDKSKAQADNYDILYVDLNANGDLTEPAERLVGQVNGSNANFQLPTLKDPATGAAHTNFSVRVSGGSSPTVMVSIKWRDQFKMGGGYPQDSGDGYLRFGDNPAAAPVMWANGDGPFRFQRWYSDKLTVGGADDFKVFVGQQGQGANSFWAFQVHFLPESEGAQATLIYRDKQGKEQQASCPLKERC